MAATQPFGFACKGGLDTNLSQLELLEFAGKATTLLNFEVDPDGGYRRINGYTPYGTTRPNGDVAPVGVFPYADGVVVCSGSNIYFSNDGISWFEINRSSVHNSGDNYTTFTGRSLLSRSAQGQSEFVFIDDGGYGKLVILDGSNPPYLFYMTGTGGVTARQYYAQTLPVGAHIGPSNADNPTTACYHKTMLIVAGISDAPNIIGYTSFTASTGSDITGSSSSNALAVDDEIVALRSFRDDVMVFCKNSIHKIINVQDPSSIAVVPVTKNVGCVSRESIQEIGGDLLFLAPDGIRTVAGTARIGDVELSSVSRQIQGNIKELTSTISTYNITSVVVREKSQYRLFYSSATGDPTNAKGFIGTFTPNGYEWSETKGIQALGIGANFDESNESVIYHGDKNGYIYIHDDGSSFYKEGTALDIKAEYITPFLDFGDTGTLKTLMYVKSSFSPEGEAEPTLKISYDFGDLNIPQPQPYILSHLPLPSLFGSAVFNVGQFGGLPDPLVRQAVEGSGHTISLTLSSEDSHPSYAINGFYIDYYPSGRR